VRADGHRVKRRALVIAILVGATGLVTLVFADGPAFRQENAAACTSCESVSRFRAGITTKNASGPPREGPPIEGPWGSLNRDEVEKATKEARQCLSERRDSARKAAKNDRAAAACELETAEVEAIIAGLIDVRELLEKTARLQSALPAALANLRQLDPARGQRGELPPESHCPDCDRLLAAAEALRALSTTDDGMFKADTGSARVASARLGRYQELAARLCDSRRTVLDFDGGRMARDARYFTWTKTWANLAALQQSLRASTFGAACR
jgi:hypothetical protein